MQLSLRTRLLLVSAALVVSSCGPVRPQDLRCQADKLAKRAEPTSAALNRYFPVGFSQQLHPDGCGVERPRLSTIETEWYSKQWSAACEPPLAASSQPKHDAQSIFRFSYLPSFDSSLFMRLESHTLIVKQMTGSGGYDPGIIARSKQIKLTVAEVASIQAKLAEILAARDANIAKARLEGRKDTCFGTLDGTMWIFESQLGGRYDMVQANSPTKGPLFDLGRMLLLRSGWIDVSDNETFPLPTT